MIKCKIIVLKRMYNKELANEYCEPKVNLCPVFKEGQEFIYEAFGVTFQLADPSLIGKLTP